MASWLVLFIMEMHVVWLIYIVHVNVSVVTCNPPVDILYSTYQPTQAVYNYSATVTYACDYGYFLSSGSLTTVCDETASWTGPSPVCSSMCNVSGLTCILS